MPGYEDLTPSQLMAIMYIILACMGLYAVSHMVVAYFTYRASKNIKFHMKREVVESIVEELQRPTLFNRIRLWWVERKKKKELY